MIRRARSMSAIRRIGSVSATFVLVSMVLFATSLGVPGVASAQRATSTPNALTDAEFWEVFTTRSEPGGQFVSENFVSNEMTFQSVIPALQRTVTPQGVYLGVGPEQNFTYIANLKPRLAVIFDIRRQNAMQHLMFKALFELSPTRAEFVARLFSRPNAQRTSANIGVKDLFDAVASASASDSAYRVNRTDIFALLKTRHGFALSSADSALLEQVYRTFYRAGPAINYGVRSSPANTFSPSYPAFGELQAATNNDGVQMAFLANEENFRVVRDMQLHNLIVPVVGDFGGPSAIRAVGEFLKKRELTVSAFYVSNVEQYLFREPGASDRFYASISALPIDQHSQIIRSVPPGGGDVSTFFSGGPSGLPGGIGVSPFGNLPASARGNSFSISISDSAGVRIGQMTQDSAGVLVTRTFRDTTGTNSFVFGPGTISVSPSTAPMDSAIAQQLRTLASGADSLFNQLRSRGGFVSPGPTFSVRGANLTVGLAGIAETLDAFFAGQLKTYGNAIDMTKTSGWK